MEESKLYKIVDKVIFFTLLSMCIGGLLFSVGAYFYFAFTRVM